MGSPSVSLAAPESVTIRTGSLPLTSPNSRCHLLGCVCVLYPTVPALEPRAPGLLRPLSSPFPAALRWARKAVIRKGDQAVAGPGAAALGLYPHLPLESPTFTGPRGQPWVLVRESSWLTASCGGPGPRLQSLRCGKELGNRTVICADYSRNRARARKVPRKPATFPCYVSVSPHCSSVT